METLYKHHAEISRRDVYAREAAMFKMCIALFFVAGVWALIGAVILVEGTDDISNIKIPIPRQYRAIVVKNNYTTNSSDGPIYTPTRHPAFETKNSIDSEQ